MSRSGHSSMLVFWARSLAAAALCALLSATAAPAAPFIWDQDGDDLDDRIETVHLLGYAASFEAADTLLHQRFQVTRLAGDLVFGVYVCFDHPPTSNDLLALTLLGMPALSRIEAVPAVRSVATFAQAQAAAALPGVERVEAVPLLYLQLRDGAASTGVRDPAGRVFPTCAGAGAPAGHGVVIAFLDTGINDAPEGSYPGHESLLGRCLGGAEITHGDSSLDTPKSGSVNPDDHGGSATSSHATHVAAIALGSGGADGYAVGLAPQARFVDVKVLTDAGAGTALPEAIDWCIANRLRDWGSPDPSERGIDILNLSLSSPDVSDGNDLASRLAARAIQLGMVVVASMGNDGLNAHVPSPAAGDGVLAVGAYDTQRSGAAGDDVWPALNNRGPRAGDGDAEPRDEMKPDLLAPGVAVLSANGDLSSDGAQYRRLTGTSMSAAFASGAAAILLSADPALGPAALAERLRATARRELTGAPAGTPGADPRWNSALGFGLLDAYAAWLETVQPERSQIRRFALTGAESSVHAELWTMRERGAAHFVFERAPETGTATPGTFVAVDSVTASGDSSLADPQNLTRYERTWPVPAPERGVAYWYRVAYSEQGVRFQTPAQRFVAPEGPSVATLEVTIVHNAYDSDIVAEVGAGAGGGPSFELPGSQSAIASDYVNGTSATGNLSWTFRIEVPAGAASAWLPPDAAHPWTLQVAEAGYLNRMGRVTDFRLIWHAPGGDQTFVGEPLPRNTVEGTSITVGIPPSTLDAPAAGFRGLSIGPNPVSAGGTVTFALGATDAREVVLYDLGGRVVGRAPLTPAAGGSLRATWKAARANGEQLPAGVYFARAGSHLSARLILLPAR